MSSRLAVLLGLATPPALASSAAAHGRPADFTEIVFEHGDPTHMAARATFGIMSSDDGGANFEWRCSYALRFDSAIENPPVVPLPSGRLLAGTFGGLTRTDAAQCELEPSSTTIDQYVIDLDADPALAGGVYATVSPGGIANRILYSADEGQTFVDRHTMPVDVLLERLVVAPSSPMRVYVSGAIPRTDTTARRVFVWRSDDAGATLAEVELTLVEGERNIHVLAVDPLDPDRVVARTTRLEFDDLPDRLLLSEDGGLTFRTLLSTPKIAGAAFVADDANPGRSTLYVGGRVEGLFRSDDLIAATRVNDVSIHCLASSGANELWACGDGLLGPFALGRSTDRGATFEPRLQFDDIHNRTGCGACTTTGGLCPYYFLDVEVDLGRVDAGVTLTFPDVGVLACSEAGTPLLDAGTTTEAGPAPFDAAVALDAAGPATTPSGCGCRAGTRGTSPNMLAVLGLATLTALRRRRRAAPCR